MKKRETTILVLARGYYTVYSIYDSVCVVTGIMSYIDMSVFNMIGNKAGMSIVKVIDTVGYNREGSRYITRLFMAR